MFKPTLIKCITCNEFYKPECFFQKDIEDMKKNKLIHCKQCKINYSVFQETLH